MLTIMLIPPHFPQTHLPPSTPTPPLSPLPFCDPQIHHHPLPRVHLSLAITISSNLHPLKGFERGSFPQRFIPDGEGQVRAHTLQHNIGVHITNAISNYVMRRRGCFCPEPRPHPQPPPRSYSYLPAHFPLTSSTLHDLLCHFIPILQPSVIIPSAPYSPTPPTPPPSTPQSAQEASHRRHAVQASGREDTLRTSIAAAVSCTLMLTPIRALILAFIMTLYSPHLDHHAALVSQ